MERQMTFVEFRASRQFCSDLSKTIHASFFEDYAKTPIGLVYASEVFIEISDGKFTLTLGNEQKTSENLEALEEDLYDYCIGEGLFE
jgi:hypothetical protein